MAKRKPVVLVAVVGGMVSLLAALGVLFFSAGSSPSARPLPREAAMPSGPASPATGASAAPAPSAATAIASEDGPGAEVGPDAGTDWVTYLRERYGKHLADPHARIRMLEQLIRYFRARNPERWEEDVLALLKAAFPERYEELAALLRNRTDYEKWVKANTPYLRTLSDKERHDATWAERNRLFGEDAAKRIWAAELKAQSVVDALKTLDAREGVSVTEKVSRYKQSIEQVYGEEAAGYLARHQQEAMNRFLDLSSIQRDLSAMKPPERAENLRTIRKELGLDDEALNRWDALDATRDQRWDAGARYMQEREALAKQYSGAELEQRLGEARARYFGTEAEVIANEESAGFFRFTQPRRWGRN